jgi:predicted membrane channel-forming protein YqfA (hemolysin III family)
MNAFKAQQHRWTKGGAQCCVKLLPKVLTSHCPLKVKIEAFFHLTSCFAYILMVMLALLIGPALYAKLKFPELNSPWLMAFEMVLFFVGFGSGLVFYICSQRELFRNWFDCLRYIPPLLAVGIGIAFNNAVAAIDGFRSKAGEFVRTPKFGDEAHRKGNWRGRMSRFRMRGSWKTWAELAIGVYMAAFTVSLFFVDDWIQRISAAIPFMLIFVAGYFYISFQTFYGQWLSQRDATRSTAG